ncbi:tol-pal system-associated acyl-CoA thioesterase [Trinickia caryophylli]|uniref:(3S)-malyl-CoA thioesterase n=1 Tax=Trinickia caryophylli TaxID=28094 RepID=A0A1X7CEQ5_TRICW|nr:tol-pal system-associated acyl-CoA thioesterase [Trinickia caryophylli]PMS12602.1 tol-pal system-associated acyl-CoA thioesterase [Trinickia caryophylli]TRX19807.1 tol-pal system-associated acyl-CoA thioesterase [Trinickia caryophylli]WQE12864.1 tol-pal system-associated acyl-CoA thioesterase [Trinickia caryophylli]SME95373.1 (3S)-malyl-CoA thioesterase [Trinickia caryophylli]GLU30586.1 thioesterase [Trinickia caryophylli]
MNTPSSRPQADSGIFWPIRVYYEDTDAAGIVFYANYLKYFERARTEWLRACGVEQSRLERESGIFFVVRRTTVDYLAPARLDDMLTVESRVERLRGASVDFMQQLRCGDRVLASGAINVACLERLTFRPVALPPEVVAALREGPRPMSAGLSAASA